MAKELISAGLVMKIDETELTGLLSVPDLGEGEKEKLEVTDLSDRSKRYISGLADTPDSFEFEFQYQSDQNSAFYVLMDKEADGQAHKITITFTDGLEFSFNGMPSKPTLSAVAVGESLKFTCSITPNSAIEIKRPSFGA